MKEDVDTAFIRWVELETEFDSNTGCWYCNDEKFETIESLYQFYLKDIEKYPQDETN